MFDFLLSEEEKAFRDEVRDFVKTVPSQLLRDMDAGKIETGRPFLEMAAARNLLGARFPKEYGGRGLNWTADRKSVV